MIGRTIRRVRLAVAIWFRYLVVKALLVRKLPLPKVVETLRRRPHRRPPHQEPRQLGRSIVRSLSIGNLQPRCLTLALVHSSFLQDMELAHDLVIGLPRNPTSVAAHAWIELDGIDIGPPPGRHGHEEMARF
jgi:hypothetical protein